MECPFFNSFLSHEITKILLMVLITTADRLKMIFFNGKSYTTFYKVQVSFFCIWTFCWAHLRLFLIVIKISLCSSFEYTRSACGVFMCVCNQSIITSENVWNGSETLGFLDLLFFFVLTYLFGGKYLDSN